MPIKTDLSERCYAVSIALRETLSAKALHEMNDGLASVPSVIGMRELADAYYKIGSSKWLLRFVEQLGR